MKKMKLILIFLLIFFNLYVFAAPPYPDVIKKHKEMGTIEQLENRMNVMKSMGIDKSSKVFPDTGDCDVLVIIVQYSDMNTNAVSTESFYSDLFNGGGSTILTFKKYYQDMSGGSLNLNFDIVGPYTASNTLSYYGVNNAYGNDSRPGTLVGEAVDAAYNDGVDFSKYDNDGDGNVDGIIIIHAERGEETGAGADRIWSHRWNLSSAQYYGDGTGARNYNGVIINDYAIQPEYNYSAGDSTIGVFCHEFGHILGLMDLYDVNYVSDGVGYWSLMASGCYNGPITERGSVPAPLLAWEKDLLGWLTVNTADNKIHKKNTANKIAYASFSIFGVILLISLILNFIFGKNKRLNGILMPVFLFFILPTVFIFYTNCPLITEEEDEEKPKLPNMTVSNFTVPGSVLEDTDFDIGLEIQNNGKKTSADFSVRIYKSTDNVITDADENIGTILYTSIEPGEDQLQNLTLNIDTSGGYYLGFIIDESNNVKESNENDNISTGGYVKYINISQIPMPNLLPKSLTTAVNYGEINTDIDISIEVENNGNLDAGSFNTNLYFSNDSVITSSDTLLHTVSSSGISSGNSETSSFTVTLPGTAGLYYIGYIVDTQDSVTESNEADNITTVLMIKTIEVIPEITSVNLTDIDVSSTALKISTGYSYSGGEQYYLIENKLKKTGTWSEYLPGEGLLVCLIDEYIINREYSNNRINSLTYLGEAWVHGVTIIEADDNYDLFVLYGDRGSATDTFYNGNVSETELVRNNITGYNTGTAVSTDSGVHLINIGNIGSTVSFDYYVE